MTAMQVELPADPGELFTVDDLDAIPYDGRRYELYDGVLVVSPAPLLRHQRMVFRLARLLDDACPADLEVLPGPLDVVVTPIREFEPDILVVPAGLDLARLHEPPALVVEVRSSSTAVFDTTVKREMYAEFGIPAYWVADPNKASITVYELRGGSAYDEVARAEGDETITLDRPFPVTVTPAPLV